MALKMIPTERGVKWVLTWDLPNGGTQIIQGYGDPPVIDEKGGIIFKKGSNIDDVLNTLEALTS